MSLHAQLSPEALALLQKQERKSKILSGVIACLVILLIAGILALFAIPMMLVETPTIVTYAAEPRDNQDIQEKKVVQQSQRKPSAPAQNMAKVIAAATSSPTAIPVPDVVVTEPSMHFGDDLDFGQGWADDIAIGGSGGSFGSTDSNSGGLEGFLYDLKQDRRGNPLPYQSGRGFVTPLLELQRSGFAPDKLRQYFQSPIPLYLTRVAIPHTPADEGPKLFQADQFMEPIGWFALYRGKVVVPRDGTFRFSGLADDYLYVAINGKAVLHAHYPHIQGGLSVDWKTPEQPGEHSVPYQRRGLKVIYGDWVELRRGQIIDLDIGIGENPGGALWFFLQIEEKGVEYRQTPQGRPILPLFTTTLILPDDIKEIREAFTEGNREYEFEYDMKKVPVFELAR